MLPSFIRLAVWTCAAAAGLTALAPAAAEAQPPDPFPPPGVYYGPVGPGYVEGSSARLLVTPKEAGIYVDGRFAGKVDGFDGFTERLRLPAGGHELAFYLEGYRTLRQKLNFEPGVSYKIKGRLEKLAAGESSGPRPEPPAAPRRVARAASRRSPAPPVERSPDRNAFGTLAIRVQPFDTTVLIDEERWEAPEPGKRLVVQVADGTHRVEVRKEGWRTFSTSVHVREGEVTTLNVSLPELEPR